MLQKRWFVLGGLLLMCLGFVINLTNAQTFGPCGASIIVQRGDTLNRIAQRCQTSVAAIRAVNPDIEGDLIVVAEELALPPVGLGDLQIPIVAISPLAGNPGTTVRVVANGFPPNDQVFIEVKARSGGDNAYSEIAVTDFSGTFSRLVTIPADAPGGSIWTIEVTSQDRSRLARSFPFAVNQAIGSDGILPTVPPSRHLFNEVTLFLTDTGVPTNTPNSFGCGDRLVPVQVEVEPTPAPLTAALETMFAINRQNYGPDNLYNVFANSQISLQRIDLVNREARLFLIGELNLAGVCDNPRVIAQVEQTALQFTTIDRVAIFLNGDLIDETRFGPAEEPTPEVTDAAG